MSEFDWSHSENVIFHSYAAVAVYVNGDGDLVIRQKQDGYEDEDSVVIIPGDMVPRLLNRIAFAADLKQSPPKLVEK